RPSSSCAVTQGCYFAPEPSEEEDGVCVCVCVLKLRPSVSECLMNISERVLTTSRIFSSISKTEQSCETDNTVRLQSPLHKHYQQTEQIGLIVSSLCVCVCVC